MVEKIQAFLSTAKPWKKSIKKVRALVAEHFGGVTTCGDKYAKIDGIEYFIVVNPDDKSGCGYTVREMDWGNAM